MNKSIFLFLSFTVAILSCDEIPRGMTVLEAEEKGIYFDSLNVTYKSAVSTDTTNSVFKNESDMVKSIQEYQNMLDEFGKYLSEHNFNWPFATSCFQKVYFNEDGHIDYYLFNFLGEPPYEVSAEQELKFKKLLNEFIKGYKFSIKANQKYSQCGTVVYGLKKDNTNHN